MAKSNYSSNDMRSRTMNSQDICGKSTVENHRVQTSGHSKNDMKSIVKNNNNTAYYKDLKNRENQKSTK